MDLLRNKLNENIKKLEQRYTSAINQQNTIDLIYLFDEQSNINKYIFVDPKFIDLELLSKILTHSKIDTSKLNNLTIQSRQIPIHFDGLYIGKQFQENETDGGYIDFTDDNELLKGQYFIDNIKSDKLTSEMIGFNKNVGKNIFVSNTLNPNEIINFQLFPPKIYFKHLLKKISCSDNPPISEIETLLNTKINIDIDDNSQFWFCHIKKNMLMFHLN
jgi:hypothetical protein